jgi:hypothetical protein
MLPFHDFKAAAREFNRRSWPAISWFSGLIGIGVAYALFALTHLRAGQHNPDPTGQFWAGSAFAVLFAAVLCGMVLVVKLAPDKKAFPMLHCPNCNRFLCDAHGLAIATGRCPSCLKDVLKLESSPALGSIKLLRIEELQRVSRTRTRLLHIGLTVFGAGWIASILVTIAYYYLVPLSVQTALMEASLPFTFVLLLAPFVLLLGPMLYLYCALARCPHCRAKILDPAIAIASGNCPRCSRPIVENTTPYTEYRPLPKLEQVKSAYDAYGRRVMTWMFLSFLFIVAVVGPVRWLSQSVLPDTYQANVARVVLYIVACSIAVVPCFYIVWRSRSAGYAALNCVHCGGVISEAHAIARCTGNCPHCGQRAIKDA